MKQIRPRLTSIFESKIATSQDLATCEGIIINDYYSLRKEVAKLACANSDYVLFFRGQKDDYSDNLYHGRGSSFFPSLYRCKPSEVENRWQELDRACLLLKKSLTEYVKQLPENSNEYKEISHVIRKRLLQWSLLQHYEVTNTPLLDLTQSLKVACSFAYWGNSDKEYAYIYVFAMPYNTGRITVNSEHYLTTIRLISIAPSCSLRPHFQEGFLVGEDTFDEHEQKSVILDFKRRLVGKFRIPRNGSFWENARNPELNERKLYEHELYPDIIDEDPIAEICRKIKQELITTRTVINNGAQASIGDFLNVWNNIENALKEFVFHGVQQVRFVPSIAISHIHEKKLRQDLNELRYYRNRLIHGIIGTDEILNMIERANELNERLRKYLQNV